MKITLGEMRLAIHQTQDCDATNHVSSTKVTALQGSSVVAIDVHLFQIEGHPTAFECYAWGVDVSENRIVIPTVLRTIEMSTPAQAVMSWHRP